MNRRDLLCAAAGLALTPLTRANAAPLSLKDAAREAWLYGLPLIEMATTRARAVGGQGTVAAGVNSFRHTRQLATNKSRGVTAPNNDTLYSSAWMDLTKGPLTLTIPPTGARYISVAGMNMFTDNDFVLGTRTVGGAGGRFTVVGPGQPGGGPNVVRLTTPQGWLLARTLVDGPSDLAAVHRVQDGLTLNGPATAPSPSYAARSAAAAAYFASVAALLRVNPPPATDGALFARVAALGLTASGGFDPARFDARAMAEIEAGVAEARAALQAPALGAPVQGWRYPRQTLGYYGQDYGFRAGVALAGLAALPPAEAMYMNPVGDRGRMLLGPGPWRLHFEAGKLPAVDGFWSLTLYEATPEGQFFLAPNPLDRFSIGDRTPGLKMNRDGSLDIWIARADPGGERSSNWLPAPPSGAFSLSFRAYLPTTDFQDGRYRLPALGAG